MKMAPIMEKPPRHLLQAHRLMKYRQIDRREHKPVCPLCNQQLRITPVNVSRCTAVGGEWKTSAMCLNANCRYSTLSEKSMQEWRIR